MTNKIRIKELPCFPSVAAVLGKAEAERQLFIAISGYDEEDYIGNIYSTQLGCMFTWACTPQGRDYWWNIDDKISRL